MQAAAVKEQAGMLLYVAGLRMANVPGARARLLSQQRPLHILSYAFGGLVWLQKLAANVGARHGTAGVCCRLRLS
jgi:hypothetical protein